MKHPLLALVISQVFLCGLAAAAASDHGAGEPPSPAEDGTLPALTSIAGHGMMESRAYDDLEELSDDIGGRVTGSPAAARAIDWGLAKMRSMGLENVHAEKWQLSRGWTRGLASVELIEPIHRSLAVDSLGWVGSTPAGGVEAEVVIVHRAQLADEMKNNTGRWAGRVLLVTTRGEPTPSPQQRQQPRAEPGRYSAFLKAAYAAHAVAVIGGQGGSKAQGMRLTHTGSLGYSAYYDIPVVSMAAEDQEQLERFLDRGKAVRVKINVQNRVTDGPVESANVVGEIRGSTYPEQVVVVGGHLDSWDLAEGSTDDGTGVACTLGAARAILASGHRPKRTLRFALFTGEEQGLVGSLEYAKAHKGEMANHVAAVILDNGQGPVTALNMGGRKDLIPAVQSFVKSVKAFGDITVDDNVSFGTDSGPFTLAGLPGINMNQDSPEYRYTHHSAVDTLDKVKPEILTRDVTVMALTAYWIADRPERLAAPWPAEQTAKMLVEKKEDGMLKANGIWPFGDLGGEEKDKKTAGQ